MRNADSHRALTKNIPEILAEIAIVIDYEKKWTLDKLTDHSEQLVKDHVYPNAKPDTQIAVDTVFEISGVLKGKAKEKPLAVRHYRYFSPKAENAVTDGPSFAKFDPELKVTYLIFLKISVDGTYEPLTGQVDPGNSFFRVDRYHVSRERQKPSDRKAD